MQCVPRLRKDPVYFLHLLGSRMTQLLVWLFTHLKMSVRAWFQWDVFWRHLFCSSPSSSWEISILVGNKHLRGTRKVIFVTVIHGSLGRWHGRSWNVNAAVIRVVLIPRAWHLSMHQSQSCVSRGEPTGINLEPDSETSCSTPLAIKDRHHVHSRKHKLELNQCKAPHQHSATRRSDVN